MLEAQFPSVSQRRLPRLWLDNFPILFDHGDFQRGSRYFKFDIMWLKSEHFIDSKTVVGLLSFTRLFEFHFSLQAQGFGS